MGIPLEKYANVPLGKLNLHVKALTIIIIISFSSFLKKNSAFPCAKCQVFAFPLRQTLLKEVTTEKPHAN